MGRPQLFTRKKIIAFNDKMLAEIDEWRQRQDPVLSFSDAVRKLIKLALAKSK
jgi:hypothetical protein